MITCAFYLYVRKRRSLFCFSSEVSYKALNGAVIDVECDGGQLTDPYSVTGEVTGCG